MSDDRLSQAITAYEADQHKQAARLLTSIVKDDSTNDVAWYYLGLVQKDSGKRKQCFERALRINPQNMQASQALAEMESGTSPQSAPPDNVTPMPKDMPKVSKPTTSQTFNVGFLSAIPGAPESISADTVTTQAQALSKASLPTLMRRTDVETDTSLSTWWQVILSVALVSFVIGVINVVASVIQTLRFEATLDFMSVMLPPFFAVMLGCVALGAGSFLSHWYLNQNGGSGSLLDHSASVVRVWVPISMLLALVGLIEVIVLPLIDQFRGGSVSLEQIVYNGFPTLSGGMLLFTLISLGIVGYGIFLLQNTFMKKHSVDSRQAWIGAVIVAVVIAFVF